MLVMNGTIKISLAPVIDHRGAWGGIWIKANPDSAQIITNFAETLNEGIGNLRIFLDVGHPVPPAVLDGLPPSRTWLVDRGSEAADFKPFEARGFHTASYCRQFVTDITDKMGLDAAKAGGGEWFCGEFVTHPPVITGKKESSRASLLKLLTLVAQDADSAEIELVFKREPELSFNLFRLVNSVSMGLNTKISTFNQAIMVLGRRQMQRWIQLMLYTSNQSDTDAGNPLLQLAAMRARLMERFAMANGWDTAEQERAFMAGIFSLLDTLLGMPMAEIVSIIALPDDVQSALLGQDGKLSQLLCLVSRLQAGDAHAELPEFMGISAENLAECQFDALKWTAGINQEMG